MDIYTEIEVLIDTIKLELFNTKYEGQTLVGYSFKPLSPKEKLDAVSRIKYNLIDNFEQLKYLNSDAQSYVFFALDKFINWAEKNVDTYSLEANKSPSAYRLLATDLNTFKFLHSELTQAKNCLEQLKNCQTFSEKIQLASKFQKEGIKFYIRKDDMKYSYEGWLKGNIDIDHQSLWGVNFMQGDRKKIIEKCSQIIKEEGQNLFEDYQSRLIKKVDSSINFSSLVDSESERAKEILNGKLKSEDAEYSKLMKTGYYPAIGGEQWPLTSILKIPTLYNKFLQGNYFTLISNPTKKDLVKTYLAIKAYALTRYLEFLEFLKREGTQLLYKRAKSYKVRLDFLQKKSFKQKLDFWKKNYNYLGKIGYTPEPLPFNPYPEITVSPSSPSEIKLYNSWVENHYRETAPNFGDLKKVTIQQLKKTFLAKYGKLQAPIHRQKCIDLALKELEDKFPAKQVIHPNAGIANGILLEEEYNKLINQDPIYPATEPLIFNIRTPFNDYNFTKRLLIRVYAEYKIFLEGLQPQNPVINPNPLPQNILPSSTKQKKITQPKKKRLTLKKKAKCSVAQLKNIFEMLVSEGYIEETATFKNFKKIFGKISFDKISPIKWTDTAGKNKDKTNRHTLLHLINQLCPHEIKKATQNRTNKGIFYTQVTDCFLDIQGNPFDRDSLKNTFKAWYDKSPKKYSKRETLIINIIKDSTP